LITMNDRQGANGEDSPGVLQKYLWSDIVRLNYFQDRRNIRAKIFQRGISFSDRSFALLLKSLFRSAWLSLEFRGIPRRDDTHSKIIIAFYSTIVCVLFFLNLFQTFFFKKLRRSIFETHLRNYC